MYGMSMLEMAALDIPITPGFILEISKLEELSLKDIRIALDNGIQLIEKETGRKLGDTRSPLLLQVSLSPSVDLGSTRSIDFIGLNDQTSQTLADLFDSRYAFNSYNSFIRKFSFRFLGISDQELNQGGNSSTNEDLRSNCGFLLSNIVKNFPQNPYSQLEVAVFGMAKNYFSDELNHDIPASLVIQYIPYGERQYPSCQGSFITRDPKTGDPKLSGSFKQSTQTTDQRQDLQLLDQQLLEDFDNIAATLEGFFMDAREVWFFIERGKIWILEQKEIANKTPITKLRILADLLEGEQISDEEFVKSISPNELNSLLYSTIDRNSVKNTVSLQGGIAGSLGATSGRVFFSTKKLMEAYWKAKANDEDTSVILLMKSTFAEDVQAVEIGVGVITSDGGYTSHAPIVARSLGKPAIIFPGILFNEDHVLIAGHKIEEGQYISMDITGTEEPIIFLDKAELEYPDIEKSGVKFLLDKAKKFTMGVKTLANADTPDEARHAKRLGADGIGLCRTEHMFLRDGRIYDFRELLITKDKEDKKIVLQRIKKFLASDFAELFEIMDGMPITIRLLDAPLHEFLPSNDAELEKTLKNLKKMPPNLSKSEIFQSFNRMKETNPMLGHRGCRVGISSPEIYDIQTMAILEAALKVKTEKNIEVHPSIMIPLIMSQEEMYLVKNGQKREGKEDVKGIIGVIREFMKVNDLKRQPFSVKIGTMIELPAAALSGGDIAKQAEFFSFGTNDLTQTTMGLSRDDINSFLPTYTEMDIWKNDPFKDLADPVKTLIEIAIRSGRQVRPDLKTGICGEHGANPEVIKYCLEAGMDYISCSPFGIPVAILTVAQSNLSKNRPDK